MITTASIPNTFLILFAVFLLRLDTVHTQKFQSKANFIEADVQYTTSFSNDFYGDSYAFYVPPNAAAVTITWTCTTIQSYSLIFGSLGNWPAAYMDRFSAGDSDLVPCVENLSVLAEPGSSFVAHITATTAPWSFNNDFIPGSYAYFASAVAYPYPYDNGNFTVHVEYCPPGEIAAELLYCAPYTEITTPYVESNVPIAFDPFYKFYLVQVPKDTAQIKVMVTNSLVNMTVGGRVGSAGTLNNFYSVSDQQVPDTQPLTAFFYNPPAGPFVITVKCDSDCVGNQFDVSIDMTTCSGYASHGDGLCSDLLVETLYEAPIQTTVGLDPDTWVYLGIHLGPMVAASCNVTLTKGAGSSLVFYREGAWPTWSLWDDLVAENTVFHFFPEDFYVPTDRWFYLGFSNNGVDPASWDVDVQCVMEYTWDSLPRLHWMEPETNYSVSFNYNDPFFGDLFAFYIPPNASSIQISWTGALLLAKLGTWPINTGSYIYNGPENYMPSLDLSVLQYTDADYTELSAGTSNFLLPYWLQGGPFYEFVPGSYIYFSFAMGDAAWVQVHVEYCPEGQIAADTPTKCAAYQAVPVNFTTEVLMDSDPFYKYYMIEVPENTAQVAVVVTNTTGSIAIYGRIGSAPTDFNFYGNGTNEAHFSNPPAGPFVVVVRCSSDCIGNTFNVEIKTITCPDFTASDGSGNCIYPLLKGIYTDTLGTHSVTIPPTVNAEIPMWVYFGVHFGPLAINYCKASVIELGGIDLEPLVFFRKMAWPTTSFYDVTFAYNDTIEIIPEDMYVPTDMWYYLGFYNPTEVESQWELTVTCDYVNTSPLPSPSPSPSASPSATPSSFPTPSSTPSATPSASSSASRSASPSSIPSVIPSAVPSASPSAIPSAVPSASSSASPSSIPSASRSASPSATPSVEPSTLSSPSPSAVYSSSVPSTPSASPVQTGSSSSSPVVPSVTPTSSLGSTPSLAPSPTSTNSNNSKKSSSKLGTGGIIGIAVGVPLGAFAIIGAFFLVRNQRKQSGAVSHNATMQTEMKHMAPKDEESATESGNTSAEESEESSDDDESSEENSEESEESTEPSASETN